MNKYIAELFGTAVLVFVGCASVAVTAYNGAPAFALSIVQIGAAFGLTVTAMAYAIGPVSGCHINPAVSLGAWAAGRLPTSDLAGYIVAQVIGAFIGAGLLAVVLGGKAPAVFGQNTYDPAKFSTLAAFLVEAIATFIFVTVILNVTRAKSGAGALAGLIIGLTLMVLHFAFIPATGNSLNPARTLAPNLYVGGQAAAQIWLYVLAPAVGGLLAGLVAKAGLLGKDEA